MEWISIKKQLPEEYRSVLVLLDNGCMFVGQYEGGEPGKNWGIAAPNVYEKDELTHRWIVVPIYNYVFEYEDIDTRITHWMPLPSAVKE